MPDLAALIGLTDRRITRAGGRRTVRMERPYDASPAELWTEPERLARWIGVLEGERRVGATVTLTMSPPDDDTATLRIEVCDEPSRLAATWVWPGEPDSHVEVLLRPDGDRTILTLEHSAVLEESAVDYGYGWEDFLNRLGEYVASRDPSALLMSDAERELKPLWQAELPT